MLQNLIPQSLLGAAIASIGVLASAAAYAENNSLLWRTPVPELWPAPPPPPKPNPLSWRLEWRTLPPLRYDHPYAGELHVVTEIPPALIRFVCGAGFDPPLACAARNTPARGHCTVWFAQAKYLASFDTRFDQTWRHEIGHCNGWGADHAAPRGIEEREMTRAEELGLDARPRTIVERGVPPALKEIQSGKRPLTIWPKGGL
jgi:hypothetical protein